MEWDDLDRKENYWWEVDGYFEVIGFLNLDLDLVLFDFVDVGRYIERCNLGIGKYFLYYKVLSVGFGLNRFNV